MYNIQVAFECRTLFLASLSIASAIMDMRKQNDERASLRKSKKKNGKTKWNLEKDRRGNAMTTTRKRERRGGTREEMIDEERNSEHAPSSSSSNGMFVPLPLPAPAPVPVSVSSLFPSTLSPKLVVLTLLPTRPPPLNVTSGSDLK